MSNPPRPPAVLWISSILLPGLLAACAGEPAPTGYWEGEGTVIETPMKDFFRTLTREAEFKFWFVLDERRDAVGEIELVYDVELRVENLPQVTIPTPGAAPGVTFDPEVGGTLTELNPRRTFPLVGTFQEGELALQIATVADEREPLEFTLRGDPGVSAGIGVDGGTGTIIQKIDMTPFSPFLAPAPVEKRQGGPFAARYESSGDRHAVHWSARQVGGERRNVELTPELENALDRLRADLGW